MTDYDRLKGRANLTFYKMAARWQHALFLPPNINEEEEEERVVALW